MIHAGHQLPRAARRVPRGGRREGRAARGPEAEGEPLLGRREAPVVPAARRRLSRPAYSGVMALRRDRIALATFALVVASWMVAEALTGFQAGLLYLAPALLLALPLLFGRYVGEEQLVELAARPPEQTHRRALRLARPRSYARVMQRGGRLVASG